MKRSNLSSLISSSSSNNTAKRLITRCRCRWTSLPDEILVTIAELLTAPDGLDFVRFGAVCKSWRSAAATVNFTLVRQMPWIMLQPTCDRSRETQIFNPSESKFYSFPLPEARWTKICGSVKSWVATVEDDRHLHLLDLNPFSSHPRRLRLPSLHDAVAAPHDADEFCRFVSKLCMPSSPTEDPNGMAVAIYGTRSRLAFARLGSRAWTTISCSTGSHYDDVVSCNGRFYAVNDSGDVMKLDLRRRQTVKIASSPMESDAPCCLVESAGDLLQVVQCPDTELRKVFKLDFGTGEWEDVKSLGERSLLLGLYSYSTSVHAPEYFGCRSNCIYIIREECDTLNAMVVYSLEQDKEIEIQDIADKLSYDPKSPLWVSPFLWWQKS